MDTWNLYQQITHNSFSFAVSSFYTFPLFLQFCSRFSNPPPLPLDMQGGWWTQRRRKGGLKGVKTESWRLQRWTGPLLLRLGTQMSPWQISQWLTPPPNRQAEKQTKVQKTQTNNEITVNHFSKFQHSGTKKRHQQANYQNATAHRSPPPPSSVIVITL